MRKIKCFFGHSYQWQTLREERLWKMPPVFLRNCDWQEISQGIKGHECIKCGHIRKIMFFSKIPEHKWINITTGKDEDKTMNEILIYYRKMLYKKLKCWWIFFHDWTQWHESEDEPFIETRICKKCGKKQRFFVG